MKTNILTAAAATLALIATPVLAQKNDDKAKRENSQGRANASDRGRERANQNSAIADVKPGQDVQDRDGKKVGKVKEVKRAADGTIALVIVILNVQINGTNIVQLTPGSFTIVNGVLVTAQITAPTGS